MIKQVLLVGLGGFAGSILRYLTYLWIDKDYSGAFPLATFSVNIIGSFLLGMLYGAAVKSNIISPEVRLLLGVGICGSYTTFSTFAFENMGLMQQKDMVTAFAYVAGSIIAGILAAYGGYSIFR